MGASSKTVHSIPSPSSQDGAVTAQELGAALKSQEAPHILSPAFKEAISKIRCGRLKSKTLADSIDVKKPDDVEVRLTEASYSLQRVG